MTRSDLRRVLAWPALIDAVRDALLMRQAGAAATPVSGQISLAGALLHLKAGALSSPGVISVKANLRPEGGRASGLITLFDSEEGRVAAVLDSADITAMRTAAMATLAAETLAAPGANSLAILGAGPVARGVLACLPTRLPISRVHVWSRTREAGEDLARLTALPVELHGSPGEATRGAAIVVTATAARAPYLEYGDLAGGSLVLAMGADSPGKRELAASILDEAVIVADQRDDVLNVGEASYLAVPQRHRVVAELGELLAVGEAEVAARVGGGRVTVFDSVGSATVDAMVCRSIVALAAQRGLGQTFDFAH